MSGIFTIPTRPIRVDGTIFPAESWVLWGLPRNGLPCLPLLDWPHPPGCATWRAFVTTVCNMLGLRNSLICEFSVIASSSLLHRSRIWEFCVLTLALHFCWALDCATSSPDSDSTAETDTALELALGCWWVPRTLANLLRNCVNVTLGICNNKVFAIDALLQSYSWFA